MEFSELIGENLVFVLIGACFVVSVVVNALTKIVTTMARERSRREIAAYVAEGSISPEQGERMMRAEVDRGQRRN